MIMDQEEISMRKLAAALIAPSFANLPQTPHEIQYGTTPEQSVAKKALDHVDPLFAEADKRYSKKDA